MEFYVQLTQAQRYQIKALLSVGIKKPAIARELGVDRSTIYREVKRNIGKRGYRPKQAHEKALKRRIVKSQSRISAETWSLVEEKLCEDWSPEQVSGRLKKNGISISHERIYQYVYADKRAGGTLWKHLRCQGKKRRKCAGGHDHRGKNP